MSVQITKRLLGNVRKGMKGYLKLQYLRTVPLKKPRLIGPLDEHGLLIVLRNVGGNSDFLEVDGIGYELESGLKLWVVGGILAPPVEETDGVARGRGGRVGRFQDGAGLGRHLEVEDDVETGSVQGGAQGRGFRGYGQIDDEHFWRVVARGRGGGGGELDAFPHVGEAFPGEEIHCEYLVEGGRGGYFLSGGEVVVRADLEFGGEGGFPQDVGGRLGSFFGVIVWFESNGGRSGYWFDSCNGGAFGGFFACFLGLVWFGLFFGLL